MRQFPSLISDCRNSIHWGFRFWLRLKHCHPNDLIFSEFKDEEQIKIGYTEDRGKVEQVDPIYTKSLKPSYG